MKNKNYIDKAKQVLQIEAKGIHKISEELDDSFNELVELCLKTIKNQGKIVLCGVGKSGQIGQKMASTLSSTGSRATFLHPVEAMHGDLGILHKSDLLIALSYSGETEELMLTLPAVRRLGVKIAAMTGGESSCLAEYADLAVITKVDEEACPFNLAPTTTTTAMLALGDALAMVLMELNGFKIEDFGTLHPAGSIGKSLTTTVKEVMRTGDRLSIISPEDSVSDAVLSMSDARGGCAIVADSANKFLGIYTTGDLKRGISKSPDILQQKVGDVMNKSATTIDVNEMAVKALQILSEKYINAIPVINANNQVQGIIDIQDLSKLK